MARKKKLDDGAEETEVATDAHEEVPSGGRTKRAAAQKVKYQEDMDDFTDDDVVTSAVTARGSKGSRKTKQVNEVEDAFEASDGDGDGGDDDEEEEEEEVEIEGDAVLLGDDDDEDNFEEESSNKKKKRNEENKNIRAVSAKGTNKKGNNVRDEKPARGKKKVKSKEAKGKDVKTRETKGKKDGKGANKKEAQFSGPPDEVILNYLKVQNRPFSVNDIFNNMHGQIGKTQVLKTLTSLVSQREIVMKTYGKQSVYVIRQDNLEKPSQAELDNMDNQIDSIKAQLNVEKEACKLLSMQLQQIKQTPTTEVAKQTVKQLTEETAQLRGRLERIEADGAQGNLLPESEKAMLNKLYDTSRQEWKKRRRMCVDILDTIIDGLMSANSESASKSKLTAKDYMEDMGLETDEQAGLDIKIDPLAAV